MKRTIMYAVATIALALAITTATFGIQSTSAVTTVEHGQVLSSEAQRLNSGISDAAIGDPNIVPGLAQTIGPAVRDVAIPGGGCLDSNPPTGC